MSYTMMKSAGSFGDASVFTDIRGRRALGKVVGWQTLSPSRSGPDKVWPAGRRLEALFTGGLARSLIQRGQCPFEARAWRDGRRLTL